MSWLLFSFYFLLLLFNLWFRYIWRLLDHLLRLDVLLLLFSLSYLLFNLSNLYSLTRTLLYRNNDQLLLYLFQLALNMLFIFILFVNSVVLVYSILLADFVLFIITITYIELFLYILLFFRLFIFLIFLTLIHFNLILNSLSFIFGCLYFWHLFLQSNNIFTL